MFADDFGYAAKEQTPLDRLCNAIAQDDMGTFERLIAENGDLDLDGENGRALRTCSEHDRYLMAKKLMLRGADTFIVAKMIDSDLGSISKSGRFGPIAASEEVRPRFQVLSQQKHRIAVWKKEVADYVAGVGTLQKIESLEAKIDALRAALDDIAATRLPATLKKPQSAPQR